MCCGFVGTVFAIRSLNQFKKSTPDRDSVNICPTRVTSITLPDGWTLVQDGLAWYRKINDVMEELDPIAVEKWFGAHCIMTAEDLQPADVAGITRMTLTFVNGSVQTLEELSGGKFKWINQGFSSTELKEALDELPALPIRLRPSH